MQRIARTRHLDRTIEGFTVHYRETGVPGSSGIVLLHGSPSSSHSFREVLPGLGSEHYAVAPDMPGFGFSDAPAVEEFEYTFEHLATRIERFLEDIGLQQYVLYVTDFGTPVGYYLATRHPERLLGIVVQNGSVHDAGLGEPWDAVRRYWSDPTPENRAAIGDWFTFAGTRDTYLSGLPERLVPLHPRESWHLDWERLSRQGNIDAHERLFLDYRRHVDRFPEIAEYHRRHQPPCLVLWGRHDPFFDIAEVLAFHEELDRLEAHIYDGGHFLTETHADEITTAVRAFARDVVAGHTQTPR
ncbi:alpha/beta fold hydrolase [Pseudactinotalea suaedae]|uniref:alpha/beta fold hydrolase n=1 Tax=Pseudactinotalea suaedae TaxID=1524924 RepID=UPI0012E1D0D0|nr:alpha/beta hydrolase [Pseudactinotalea suaedae]